MGLIPSIHRDKRNLLLKPSIVILFGVFAAALAAAQDLTPGINYVCNGERIFIENCNIRDLSDNATCMVGHPDHVMPNGLMQYTTMTRGALKTLVPTCKQPTPQQLAAHMLFRRSSRTSITRMCRRRTTNLLPRRSPSPSDNHRNPGLQRSARQTAA